MVILLHDAESSSVGGRNSSHPMILSLRGGRFGRPFSWVVARESKFYRQKQDVVAERVLVAVV